MSSCRQCNTRAMAVREDKNAIAALARAVYRTDNPTTSARLKQELAEAKRQLARSEAWREEHEAECGVPV